MKGATGLFGKLNDAGILFGQKGGQNNGSNTSPNDRNQREKIPPKKKFLGMPFAVGIGVTIVVVLGIVITIIKLVRK